MYKNWAGPPRFLHWIIPASGENSYNLTLNEMWIVAFCAMLAARIAIIRLRKTDRL